MHSLARHQALIDGNKRFAWVATRTLCLLNDRDLAFGVDDAEQLVVAVARGDLDVAAVTTVIEHHLGVNRVVRPPAHYRSYTAPAAVEIRSKRKHSASRLAPCFRIVWVRCALVVMTMAVPLAACGGSSSSPTKHAESTARRPVEQTCHVRVITPAVIARIASRYDFEVV
jgi:hypothetical protein